MSHQQSPAPANSDSTKYDSLQAPLAPPIKTLCQLILEEVVKFASTTSIRGVPRIFKSRSKSKLLFIIWILGVLICAGILLWQLAGIFINYYSYPVNTQYVQAPTSFQPTFPDITVCNANPLTLEPEMELRYIDYQKRIKETFTMDAFQRNSNLSENYTGYYDFIQTYISMPSVYFLNFPVSKASEHRDANASMMLACEYFDWEYDSFMDENTLQTCNDSVYLSWDPDYYKCFTFRLSTDDMRRKVLGWSGIFFVEDYIGNNLSPFHVDLRDPRATGLRVAIHSPGTKPDMKNGMTVGPGTESTITLTQTQRLRLPAPYSNCTMQATISEAQGGGTEEKATYTQKYCYDVCLQKQAITAFGCLVSWRQSSEHQLNITKSLFCGNLSLNSPNSNISWAGVVRLVLALFEEEDTVKCDSQCPLPCMEYYYSPSLSTASPWPHHSSELAFYNTYIAGNQHFGNTFDEYQTILNLTETNETDANKHLLALSEKGLIRKRFLQLKVVFDGRKFNQLKDIPAIGMSAFGAQIGGVLSLWLGITVIIIVEICEFIYDVCVAANEQRRRRRTAQATSMTRPL